MKKIYVITGQTATGKTSYAIHLAKKVGGELINCDSRQSYKSLDIITGKDLEKTSRKFQLKKTIGDFTIGSYFFRDGSIPIWLYDVVTPDKQFSTFDYRTCALEALQDIIDRGRTPIIVGGTYFYLKHLLYGTVETFVEPNEELRAQLNDKTVAELQQMLKDINAEIFNNLNNSEKHNPHRLIRKIEILTDNNQRNLSVLPQDDKNLQDIFPDLTFNITGFGFSSKELLQETITKRVEERLKLGAVEEVKQLLSTYKSTDPGLQTIGYKQIIEYLQDSIHYEAMREQWITKELQYAKRQFTFMKKDTNITWKELA